MSSVDPALADEAQRFADEIADLLARTVSENPPIRALARNDRVVVAPFDDRGETVTIALSVAGDHRLELLVEFLCTWDFAGRYLAIEQSEFALKMPHLREPLIRFDYVRDHSWAPAHVQLHAESSALGWLHAFTGTRKPPKVQELHLPVGGRRLRPSLEDVIDFAIRDLAVDAQPNAAERIAEGRARWRRVQVKALIRDVIKDDPATAPAELHRVIDGAADDVSGEQGA
ncbi:MAG: hypothetical protein WD250_08290 [Egibacteraceae bacterium]